MNVLKIENEDRISGVTGTGGAEDGTCSWSHAIARSESEAPPRIGLAVAVVVVVVVVVAAVLLRSTWVVLVVSAGEAVQLR